MTPDFHSAVTGRKARKFCTDMLAWLDQKTEIVEHSDQATDAICLVVAKRHENFERKTPQMRRALEHLLGDGLFISDKETWKQRRPLVSDIVHKNRVPTFGAIMQNTASELADRWQSLGEGAEVNALFEMAGLTADRKSVV